MKLNQPYTVTDMYSTVTVANSACLTLRKVTWTTFQTHVWPVFVPVSFTPPRADCLPVRSIMMKLKNASSRVAGVAVVAPSANPLEGVSPHTTCPNENTGGWGFACWDLCFSITPVTEINCSWMSLRSRPARFGGKYESRFSSLELISRLSATIFFSHEV